MAEDKKSDKKKEKKQKKKERMDINLPNARRSMKRSREMKQMRTDYDDMWKFIGGIVVALLILFVLLGGINQGAALRTLAEWAQNVGQAIYDFFKGGEVVTNNNGVYWNP